MIAAAPKLHVFGASGSGTTTLGRALAERLRTAHFDVDQYYWRPTDPPFTTKHPPDVRVERLALDLAGFPAWVLSGSMCGWGDAFAAQFTLAIYLWIPAELRMRRLAAREAERHGARVDSDGDMHAQSQEFLAWARRYDSAGLEQRSRALHDWWMRALPCPVLRIERDAPLQTWVDVVLNRLDLV